MHKKTRPSGQRYDLEQTDRLPDLHTNQSNELSRFFFKFYEILEDGEDVSKSKSLDRWREKSQAMARDVKEGGMRGSLGEVEGRGTLTGEGANILNYQSFS